MKRAIPVLAALVALAAFGCKKGGDEVAQDGGLFKTPEKTFEQVKKALVHRNADLLWDTMSKRMKGLFDEGRKELLAKPIEERKQIATEGMTSVENLEKFDTKAFFKFYFSYKKREIYRMNSAELMDRKVDAVRTATVKTVTYKPEDPAKATKAWVVYELAGEQYMLPLVKEGEAWLVDQMDEPQKIAE